MFSEIVRSVQETWTNIFWDINMAAHNYETERIQSSRSVLIRKSFLFWTLKFPANQLWSLCVPFCRKQFFRCCKPMRLISPNVHFGAIFSLSLTHGFTVWMSTFSYWIYRSCLKRLLTCTLMILWMSQFVIFFLLFSPLVSDYNGHQSDHHHICDSMSHFSQLFRLDLVEQR